MPGRIYFDNAATAPLDPRVLDAIPPFLRENWGNPSSLHREGCLAREALENARNQVAALVGAEPSEIVFTSNGTEADNLAVFGLLNPDKLYECRVITSSIEHPAMLECCRNLERRGTVIDYLPVDQEGVVDPESLELALSAESADISTTLVSVMAANNVTGALQPIQELARIAARHGALFHTDAVQAVGKIPLDIRGSPIDLLSLSAHKIHGPKGAGALFVRRGLKISPLLHGGGQEGGLRSGTENVPAIVGFGRAAEIARSEMTDDAARLVPLRDFLIESILLSFENAYLIGPRYFRLPGHICLGFAGWEGEAIKLLLDLDEQGIAVSSGSACSSNHAGQPSHVLQAMGFDPPQARGSLRISLGRLNTEDEARHFMTALTHSVKKLRSMAGFALK